MKLSHINIENFRSIKYSSISFDKYQCRILIGMNETGKSNILKAIRTLDNSYKIAASAPQDKRFPPSDEENFSNKFSMDFWFTLDDNELLTIYNKLSNLFCCKNIENTKVFKKKEETFTLRELIQHLNGVVKHIDLAAGNRWTYIRPNQFSTKDFTIISAEHWKQIPSDVSSIVNEENKKIPKGTYKYIKTDVFPDQSKPFTESIDIKTFYDELFSEYETLINENLPQIIFWENMQDHAFHADIDIQRFMADPNTYPHFKSMCMLLNSLFPNADSISQVFQEKQKVNQLGILYRQISDKTTDYLRSIWDDFKDEKLVIDTSRGNSIIGISVENSRQYSNPFPTSFRSDGFKKFLKLMLNLSLKVNADEIRDSIILIDESELYLHPPAAEDFRDELLSLSEKNNNIVVFSTHSPFMIDGNAIKRHIIVKKENETTVLKEGEEGKWFEEELLWQALGCGIIRTLPHKTLILEGWDDRIIFKIGLDILDESDKEHIIPGDKSKLAIAHAAGASHIRHCLPAFQAANSKAIIVCDSDQAGRDEKKYCIEHKLWGHDTFYTFEDLGGKKDETAEDYLIIDRINYAIEKIKKKYKISTNPDFSIEDYRIMPQVKIWLQNEKISDINGIIEIFKEFLFKKLKQTDIKVEFTTILRNLNKKLSTIAIMAS
jgi:predicted ATP-dependent endonuclease of OLD family